MKMKLSKKLSGFPLSLIVMLVATLLVSAVLITYYSTYVADIEGDIDLEGKTSLLFYDDVGFTTATFKDTQDVTALAHGETLTESHTLRSASGNGNWKCSFDLSSMSSLYDEETDEFYGYSFRVLDDTDTDITTSTIRVIAGEPDTTIKYEHSLHDDFLDTDNPFPFALTLNLVEYLHEGMLGFATYHNSETDVIGFKEVGGNLFTVKTLDESSTICVVENPSEAGDWDIFSSTVANVDYGWSDGLKITGDSSPSEHIAVIDTSVYDGLFDDFCLSTTLWWTDSDDSEIQIILWVEDSSNYIYGWFDLDTDEVGVSEMVSGTPTEIDSATYDFDTSTDYPIKVYADSNFETVSIDVNGASVLTDVFVG